MRSLIASLFAGVVALVVSNSARSAEVTVQIVDFAFRPDPVTIDLGDTVKWEWDSLFDHSTTSVKHISESWNSGIQNPGATYTHTFTHLGEFPYYCQLHGLDNEDGTAGGMSASVIVIPEPASLLLLALGGVILLKRRP